MALDGASLKVREGELVGLLGPNGAGKSTIISLFTGLRRPSKGRVEIFGGDPREPRTRRHRGVTPQETGLPENLKVGEVIDFVGAQFPNPVGRDELLERFGLADLTGLKTGALSGGQKRRLTVALAFVGNPRIVFLDEPTTGLDVEARRNLWGQIAQYHASGGAVVLTSHYLEEIEALAKRVIVMSEGKIVADDTLEAIRGVVSISRISLDAPDLPALPGISRQERDGDRITLYTADPDQLVRDLVQSGGPSRGWRSGRPASKRPLQFRSAIAVMVLASLPFILMGLAIGYSLPSKAALVVAQILFLPMAFAGGLLHGPDSAPGFIKVISPYVPTRGAVELMWASVGDFSVNWTSVISFAVWTVVLGALAVRAHRRDEGVRYR